MSSPQPEISYTPSSTTEVGDMEIELESFEDTIENTQDPVENTQGQHETALQRAKKVIKQIKSAKAARRAQAIKTANEQQKMLIQQNEALMEQNKILMERANANARQESILEYLNMFLGKRSWLFSFYKEIRHEDWHLLDVVDPDLTPSIRIDSLIYTAGWREDDYLFEKLFGVSPAESQDICKIDTDNEVTTLLDLHARLRFYRVYISDEDEVKFDDFCRLLKESLSLGATLPDFSDGSTGSELRENFELAAFRYLYT